MVLKYTLATFSARKLTKKFGNIIPIMDLLKTANDQNQYFILNVYLNFPSRIDSLVRFRFYPLKLWEFFKKLFFGRKNNSLRP